MKNKIKFSETEVNVLSCYTEKNISDQLVLRINIEETAIKNEELKRLKENTGTIQYFENDELKAEFEGFVRDFVYSYRDELYEIEIMRKSESDLKTEKAGMNIEELIATVSMLNDEILPSLFERLETLESALEGEANKTADTEGGENNE